MNLHRIFDSKADYAKLKDLSKDNLYFNLAQKAAQYITVQNNKSPINLSWNILGNKVDFYYGKDQVNLVLGGKRYTGHGANLKALEEALYNLFQGELKGEVSLNRPEGRSFLNDRNDFNKATGTCFSKLYKSVARDKEGKKNAEVKGSRSQAPAMTVRQFENASKVSSFKADNFKKVELDGVVFYINRGVDSVSVKDIRNEVDGEIKTPSTKEFQDILSYMDSYPDYWARTPDLYRVYENIDKFKTTVVIYNGSAWIVTPKQGTYYVERLI